MRDGTENRGGMWHTRNIEGRIRDENISAESECAHFNRWDTFTYFIEHIPT